MMKCRVQIDTNMRSALQHMGIKILASENKEFHFLNLME